MKNPEELNKEERLLILNILKQINHLYSDYSDVCVGDVIFAQAIAQQPWLPKEYYCIPHNTIALMVAFCEYGFLKKRIDGLFEITRFGLEYLKINL